MRIKYFLLFIAYLISEVYRVDLENSVIRWEGRKVTGSHWGTVKFSDGVLILSGNEKDGFRIVGGELVADLSTIAVEDIKDPKDNKKLESHLKNEDFFDVDKFRYSKLVIEGSEVIGNNTYKIKGNMTIKGISHPVQVDAIVKVTDNALSGESNLSLDRTLWNIRYGSGKFFENLGDRLIYDNFEIKVKLVAKKTADNKNAAGKITSG